MSGASTSKQIVRRTRYEYPADGGEPTVSTAEVPADEVCGHSPLDRPHQRDDQERAVVLDGSHVHDAEGRLAPPCGVPDETFTYDANGKVVRRDVYSTGGRVA